VGAAGQQEWQTPAITGRGRFLTVERADKQDSSRTPFIQTKKKQYYGKTSKKSIGIDWLWLFRWKEVLTWMTAPLCMAIFWHQFNFRLVFNFKAQGSFPEPVNVT
jgi:hypothetical protein